MLIATGFGLGYLPKAPGTWGSLAGVVFYLCGITLIGEGVLYSLFATDAGRLAWPMFDRDAWLIWSRSLSVAWVAGIAGLGVWASRRASNFLATKDPQVVVIDEISGQMLALIAIGPQLFPDVNWKYVLLGFILFRVFDIWKPWPARAAEKLPGGWGIMADDWVAGVYAAAGLWGARALGL